MTRTADSEAGAAPTSADFSAAELPRVLAAYRMSEPDSVIDARLALSAGHSRARIDARPGRRTDIDLKLALASLGDRRPAAGRLAGRRARRPPGRASPSPAGHAPGGMPAGRRG